MNLNKCQYVAQPVLLQRWLPPKTISKNEFESQQKQKASRSFQGLQSSSICTEPKRGLHFPTSWFASKSGDARSKLGICETSSTLSRLTFPNRHSHLCSIGFAVCWKILPCENATKIVVLHLSCVTSFQALTTPVLALRLLASEQRQRVVFGKTKWPCNANTPALARPNGHAALIPLVVPCPVMSVERDASRRRRRYG